MVDFELFLIFIVITTALIILISIFYRIQPFQPAFHKLKRVIIMLIFLSVSLYILNSLPNLFSTPDVSLTSETVVPSNLVFIVLCISVYFFLKRLAFSENESFDNDIEEDEEFNDINDFNQNFMPKYEDFESDHNQDKKMIANQKEEDNFTSINETNFKELNEYIDDLYEKQLKS